MIALLIWLSILGYLFYRYAIKPMNYWKNKGVLQGNPVWLLGDSWKTLFGLQSVAAMGEELHNRYKNARYSGAYHFTVPALVIHDAELIKKIMIKDFDHFVDHRDQVPEHSDPLWEKNLFALKGQKWRDMRQTLTSAFTSSKIKYMYNLIHDSSKKFVENLITDNGYIDLEIKGAFTRYANDVIASTAFGVEVNSMANPENEFYLMGKEATDLLKFWKSLKLMLFIIVPQIKKIFNVTIYPKECSKFFYNIINETISARESKGIVRPDMLQVILEARKGKMKDDENDKIDTVQDSTTIKDNDIKSKELTNMDIAAQAMVFFFAGLDTVTTVTSFMAYELALNPEIQDRLRSEIIQTNDACQGELTYDTLMKMKYLDMVISETLRKWPSVSLMDRVCTKPYTIEPERPGEKPLRLEKGQMLWISFFGFHRDPRYFPDPDKFDPERFSEENKSSINPYAYMPFGLGPRACIGLRFGLLEVKAVFYYLLLNFEILPNEKTPIPAIIEQRWINLSIKGGYQLRLKRITG